MLLRPPTHRRRAASLVESAITYSVMFILTFGVIVVAMGIYYYQQVAALAREGARYAAVNGAQYALDNPGKAMATSASIQTYVQGLAAGMDTSKLTASASWDQTSEVATYDDATTGAVKTNYVTVTVNYTWNPPLYLGSMTLSSTAVAEVQY